MTKKCTRCNIEKPLDMFGNEQKGKHGKRSKCKVCMTEIRKEQYDSNKEQELAYGKQYREANAAKEKARCARYRALNPEKVKMSQKKYQENNSDKVKQRSKEWAQNNKDLANKYTKNNRDTRREFLDVIKLERGCAICGYNEHPRALQFDHIDPKQKNFTISSALTCSMDKLLTELDKCRILCANCHSIHSWNEKHWQNKKDKADPRVEITIKELS